MILSRIQFDQMAEAAEPDKALLKVAESVDDPEKIRELLNSGADVHCKDPETGATPLARSCYEGHINNVKILLETSDIESRSRTGRTPLAVAAQQGHRDIVKLLVERKADVGVKNDDGPGEDDREDGHLQNRLGAQFLLEEATQYAHKQNRDVFQDD